MFYGCHHAQVDVEKEEKEHAEEELLTKCKKTIKFLSYLYPEEAEIPLLDRKND